MLEMLQNFHADDVVVFHQRGSLQRWQLARLVENFSDRLRSHGINQGDRVMLLLPNSPELLIAYYACLASGITAVPINDRLASTEISAIVEHCSPALLLFSRDALRHSSLAPGDINCPLELIEQISPPQHRELDKNPQFRQWPDDQEAIIFYTSGSTGEPKGVLYTHKTLRAASSIYRNYYQLTSADQTVLCHCMANNFVFSQMAVPVLDAGGALHVVDFGNHEQTATALANGVSYIMLIPWFALTLIDYLESCQLAVPGVRNFVVGGDRIPHQLFTKCRQTLGIEASQNIGMTETNTYAVCPGRDNELKAGSAGLALPGYEIKITDSSGNPCPVDESGEICVRSKACMAGYWNDRESTQATMNGGWVSTGDAGHLDADGYLWFDARIKQIIICDGDNMYPLEIERAITKHPLVEQAAVFGLPDENHGERVAAALVLHEDISMDQLSLQRFLEPRLAANKIPTDWLICDSLPTNRHGKLDIGLLQARLLVSKPGIRSYEAQTSDIS